MADNLIYKKIMNSFTLEIALFICLNVLKFSYLPAKCHKNSTEIRQQMFKSLYFWITPATSNTLYLGPSGDIGYASD